MSRIAITAFSGWNDAGEAATGVIEHLLQVWPSRPVGAVDADDEAEEDRCKLDQFEAFGGHLLETVDDGQDGEQREGNA